jgi:hypothetical protein
MSEFPEHEPESKPLDPEVAERIGMRVKTFTERRYFFGIEEEHSQPFDVPRPTEGVSVEIHLPPSPTILVEDGSRYPELQASIVLRQPTLEGSPEEGWLPLGGMFEAEASIRDGSLRLYDFDGDLHFHAVKDVLEVRRERVFPLTVTIREAN